MADDAYAPDKADRDERPTNGLGVSEDEIRRFLSLVDAVRARDARATRDDPEEDESQRRRREAVFGYEVISALMGRSMPPGNTFARVLARVVRASDSLTIELIDPVGGARKPAASGLNVEMVVEGSVVQAEVGDGGIVPLDKAVSTQDITSLVVRDAKRRPIAIAGPIPRVSKTRRTRR